MYDVEESPGSAHIVAVQVQLDVSGSSSAIVWAVTNIRTFVTHTFQPH